MQIRQFFKESHLIREALTTKGYAYEHHLPYDNQRLEFLGDAVMELIISERLYREVDVPEGDLTRLRSSAVNETSFSQLARRFKLDEELCLATGQKVIDSLLADAFEAFIGAYFLTHGYEATQSFVVQSVLPHLALSDDRDPKTRLQEKLQARGMHDIVYETLAQTGPAHEAEFLVGLYIAGVEVARGQGRSKKEAQKAAAADYLHRL